MCIVCKDDTCSTLLEGHAARHVARLTSTLVVPAIAQPTDLDTVSGSDLF